MAIERSKLVPRFSTEKKQLYTYNGVRLGYYTYLFTGVGIRRSVDGTLGDAFDNVGDSETPLGTFGKKPPLSEDNLELREARSKGISDLKNSTSAVEPLGTSGLDSSFYENDGERFAFAKFGLNLMAYNSLIEGQFRSNKNKYELSGSDLERLVLKLSFGYSDTVKGWCKALVARPLIFVHALNDDTELCSKLTRTRMTFAIHARTQEYKSSESRPHVWGGLYFMGSDKKGENSQDSETKL